MLGGRKEVGLPGPHLQAETDRRRRKGFAMLWREKKTTSHVRSRVEWPLATSLTGPGVAGRIFQI